jgi:hypothetical protein
MQFGVQWRGGKAPVGVSDCEGLFFRQKQLVPANSAKMFQKRLVRQGKGLMR